jgi:molecular chaperone HscC
MLIKNLHTKRKIKMTIVGIDLGTTHSVCGFYKDGKVELIPNRFGKYLTPSIINIDNNKNIIVGDTAKEMLITHPNNTVDTFKRDMGSNKEFNIGDDIFTAVELSSMVLKRLKDDTEEFLAQSVTHAVISVPAYFNNKQRKDTIKAGELAGLNVEIIINEPTAAAIAFGLQDDEDDSVFVVLDIGGGTFDISIMEYYDQILEVQATAGDNYLGGEDFTRALMDFYLLNHSMDYDRLSLQDREKLYFIMENAKKQLNDKESVQIESVLHKGENFTITQDDFYKASKPLLLKVKKTVMQAVVDSKLSIADFNKIILVGGTSRLNIFQNLIANLFNKEPIVGIDPDLAIAMGASIQAALKAKNQELQDVVLCDVVSHSFGIGVNNKNDADNLIYSPIIHRNSVLPISRSSNYTPIHNHQTEINFSIYQGENRLVGDNLFLGEIEVDIPKGSEGKKGVDVRFSYDVNGVLEIDLEVISTGIKYNKIILNKDEELSQEQLKETLKRLAKLKFHPRDDEKNIQLLEKANKLYVLAYGYLKGEINEQAQWFESIMEKQDIRKTNQAAKDFASYLIDVEQKFNIFGEDK